MHSSVDNFLVNLKSRKIPKRFKTGNNKSKKCCYSVSTKIQKKIMFCNYFQLRNLTMYSWNHH